MNERKAISQQELAQLRQLEVRLRCCAESIERCDSNATEADSVTFSAYLMFLSKDLGGILKEIEQGVAL